MLLDVHLLHCPLIELLLLEWETLLYFLMIFIIIILLLFAILFSQEIATHRSVISFLSKTIKLYSYQICWLWAYLITVRLFQSWRWAYLITVIPELALGVPDYGYSRNASCALNFICTRYFPVSFFKSSNLTQVCRIRFLFTEGSLWIQKT
jgi:hypothetical protein